MINLPCEIFNIIKTLNEAGFEAYAVGGCVRDCVIGKEPKDFDVTTNALSEDVKRLFSKTADTGIKYGTVTVFLNNISCEVTTFRTDEKYNDHRKPVSLNFSNNLMDDLLRRDFTMNTLCCDKDGNIIDLLCGIKDIEARLVRCVGDADKRFEEDALRMLRAYRFSACLGFEIEDKTKEAIIKNKEKINYISKERIVSELKKIVLADNFKALNELVETGLLNEIFIKPKGNTDKVIELKKDFNLRFAFLLSNMYDENCILDVLKKLKLSRLELKEIFSLYKLFIDKEKDVLKSLNHNGLNITKKYVCAYKVLYDDTLEKEFDEIIKNKVPYNVSMLDVNGDDIKEFASGKTIKEMLDYALKAVQNSVIKNEKEDILMLIKNKYLSF